MQVLICPDKFAGTLSAVQAAQAIAEGWRAAAPGDQIELRPLSDGGPGFLAVLADATGATPVPVPTVDPLGRRVTGQVLLVGRTAYLESAQACGLELLTGPERDPKITTSYGLGLLMIAAVEAGAAELVIGLGGSATNDCGAGMLTALDAAPLDQAGYALPYGGAALVNCQGLVGQPRLRGVRLVAATDVDAPLTGIHGASAVFGPQKGATRADVLLLDAALERFAGVLEGAVPGCPAGLATVAGAGAAGGLGAALLAMGGRVVSGSKLVGELTGLSAALDRAELVITGEGAFDEQSLHGKVVGGVAGAASERALPCLVLAGRSSAGRREAAAAGVTEIHTLVRHFGDPAVAMARAAEGLTGLGRRLAGQWSPPR